MSHIDPVADLLVKINNANRAKLEDVKLQASKLKIAILEILVKEGYLKHYELFENKNKTKAFIKVKLKFDENKVATIHGIRQISKPGLRVYVPYEKLPKVLNGLGIAIISTSEGLMTDKLARTKKIGGEVIAYIW
ncbi:30S ribosomal protein S8 [Mycoplasmoides alvi]|uniref:30S ribosomal protein S8 n=1 Tax=Mycoplasmoides alvi TaxID=78580 RepID=UPI00051B438F|nr:30S ribosomal protein S8 [Mycoplasmoides alvi]